jgi:hypothetical protein
MSRMPYSNNVPTPDQMQVIDPKPGPKPVEFSVAKLMKEESRNRFRLDRDLTQQIQDFADAQNLRFEDAHRLLIRQSLGDPASAAAIAGFHKAYWQIRNQMFHELNAWFDERKGVHIALMREGALYTRANPINTEEGPPRTAFENF